MKKANSDSSSECRACLSLDLIGPMNWKRKMRSSRSLSASWEKGYTLIRNMTLGASGIMVPIILLGPTGFIVIQVTYLRGRYEAKGNTWNEESGNGYKPHPST